MTITKLTHNLRLAPPGPVQADSRGRIEGYASTYGGEPDRHGDVILPGAFAASLERHNDRGTAPAMLWSHIQERPIGAWRELHDEADGLRVVGQLNLQTEAGREAFEHIQAGDAGGLSIGFIVSDGGRVYAGDGIFEVREIELLEISIVSVPANPLARITCAKLASKAEAVEFLRKAGLPKAAAKRFAAGGYPALAGDDHATPDLTQLSAAIDAATKHMENMQ